MVFSMRYTAQLPDVHPILRSEIHPVALMNVIEVQELVEVLEHDVDPQVAQRVRSWRATSGVMTLM